MGKTFDGLIEERSAVARRWVWQSCNLDPVTAGGRGRGRLRVEVSVQILYCEEVTIQQVEGSSYAVAIRTRERAAASARLLQPSNKGTRYAQANEHVQ